MQAIRHPDSSCAQEGGTGHQIVSGTFPDRNLRPPRVEYSEQVTRFVRTADAVREGTL